MLADALNQVTELYESNNSSHATFTIAGANRPPVAGADSYSMNENTLLVMAAPGVLANDTDPDGNSLTALQVAAPSHGALNLNPDGSFIYTPAAGFRGVDSLPTRQATARPRPLRPPSQLPSLRSTNRRIR